MGGAAGAGIGGAIIGLGPSAAMGVATTFGVASTATLYKYKLPILRYFY